MKVYLKEEIEKLEKEQPPLDTLKDKKSYRFSSLFESLHLTIKELHKLSSEEETFSYMIKNMSNTIFDAAMVLAEWYGKDNYIFFSQLKKGVTENYKMPVLEEEILDFSDVFTFFDVFIGVEKGTTLYLVNPCPVKSLEKIGEKNFNRLCEFLDIEKSESFKNPDTPDVATLWKNTYFFN